MKISALFSVAALLSQSMPVLGYLFYRCGSDNIIEEELYRQIEMEYERLTGKRLRASEFPGGMKTAEVTFWEPSTSNLNSDLMIKVIFNTKKEMLSFQVSSSGKRIPCVGHNGDYIPREDIQVPDNDMYDD
ncbi:BgTH12-02523 [Blumeria graminis f. sp. triticale]|uniref:Bgt-51460 n=2 Tax=Blumeria graminis TaxID=34373 RepID=A0A9X9MGR2_BLUGR|nr:BgTH12-02523 [Blumeria graminis f. sp. triticale]VDB86353.1 Bgt-51460 [Blumeria graminis f. sp. tritici]